MFAMSVPSRSVSPSTLTSSPLSTSATVSPACSPPSASSSPGIMRYEIVEGGTQRHGKLLVDNAGYKYTMKRAGKKVTMWICSVRSKGRWCKATIQQKDANFIPGPVAHQHPAFEGLVKPRKNSRSVGNLCQQRLSSGWSDDSFTADSTELPQRRSEKSVNQVTLLGRVGRDSETRGSFSHPVIIFPLATNYSFANAEGQMVSRVDWHRISVFRQNLRDFVAVNIRKGDRLMVMGSLRYDRLGEGENSTMVTTIIANDIVNLTKKFLDEPQAESSEEF